MMWGEVNEDALGGAATADEWRDQVNFEGSGSIHFMRAIRMASMPYRESYSE